MWKQKAVESLHDNLDERNTFPDHVTSSKGQDDHLKAAEASQDEYKIIALGTSYFFIQDAHFGTFSIWYKVNVLGAHCLVHKPMWIQCFTAPIRLA